MAQVSFQWRTVPAAAMTSVFLVLAGDSGSGAEHQAAEPSQVLAEPDTAAANRLLQGAPSPFVPNLGQWEHPAHFLHHSGSMTVFVQDRGWTLSLVERPPEKKKAGRNRLDPRAAMREPTHQKVRGVAIRMEFEGGDRTPDLVGESKLPGVHNYFLGNDESRWRTHVPLYASVLYRQLYPGIDVRVRQAAGHPEYDLLLQPGAELAQVAVQVEGADGLHIGQDGSLVMATPLGPVTQPLPQTWEVGPFGERRDVACRYVMLGPNRFGFQAPGWTGDRPLTIDPGLLWSTYLGGGNWDTASGFVDEKGVVTVAGFTISTDFPTTLGAFQATYIGGGDAFVSQLDPSKTGTEQLVYSTYLGGIARDSAAGVFTSTSGVVTLFGFTSSGDFPTTPGAFRSTSSGSRDIFVSQVDPSKTGREQIVYSTYLGGSGIDHVYSGSGDVTGAVTIVGVTASWDYPTTPGAFDRTLSGGNDAFVSRLVPTRTGSEQLVFSSFLGGSSAETAYDVAVDTRTRDVITVAGWTVSSNFPATPGAFDTTFNGGFADAFVTQLDLRQRGTEQLLYSTFLGGSASAGDFAYGASVDKLGVVTVTGTTASRDYPTTLGAYDRTHNGGLSDAFISRLDPTKTENKQLVYSTFLGGGSDEGALGAPIVDAAGVVTLAGYTGSSGFPTTPGALDTTYAGPAPERDGFVSRLDPSRTGFAQLLYSTFLGGSDGDLASLCKGEVGRITLAGTTKSANFPTTPGAYDTTFNGTGPNPQDDVFITQLDMLPTGVTAYGTSSPGCTGPLAMSVSSWPQAGNAVFSLTCNNAPPNSVGAVLLGASALTTPFPFLGVDLWVDPAGLFFLALPTASNQIGAGDFVIPLPLGTAGGQLAAQFVWFGPSSPAPCPPGAFSASNALAITIQP